MDDYAESLEGVLAAKDAGRFSQFLWEWGLRMACPRLLDYARRPAADLDMLMRQVDRESGLLASSSDSGSRP